MTEAALMPWSQGHLYATPDGRLKIFACDLFLLTPQMVGGIESVWDRSGGRREGKSWQILLQGLPGGPRH